MEVKDVFEIGDASCCFMAMFLWEIKGQLRLMETGRPC